MRAVILGGVILFGLAVLWKPHVAIMHWLYGLETADRNVSAHIAHSIERGQEAPRFTIANAVRVDASQEALVRVWQCLEAWDYDAPGMCLTEVSNQYLALGKAYGLERRL
jgi:hypothetical protein